MSSRVVENVYIEIEFEMRPEELKKVTKSINLIKKEAKGLENLRKIMKLLGSETIKSFTLANRSVQTITKSVREVKKQSVQLNKTIKTVNQSAEKQSSIFQRIKGSIRKVNDEASTTKGKVEGLGGALKKLLPIAAILSTLTLGGNNFVKFDQQMLRVKAIAKVGEVQYGQLRESAKNLSKVYKTNALEIAKAQEFFGMAGYDANQIDIVLEPSIKLAKAAKEDIANVSDIISDSMTAFGMGVDEIERFTDILAATSTMANTNVGMMGYTFKQMAPLARMLDLDFKEVATSIGLLADNNYKGERGGVIFRNMLTSLLDPTKEAAEALNALGVEAFKDGKFVGIKNFINQLKNGLSKLDKEVGLKHLTKIFGKEAVAGISSLVQTDSKTWDKKLDELNNSKGALDRLYKIMDAGLGSAFGKFLSVIQLISLEFFEGISPGLTVIFNGVTAILEPLADFIKFLNDGGVASDTLKAAIILLTVAILKQNLAMITGWLSGTKLFKTFGLLANGVKFLAAQFQMLNLSNPLGWVIIAISLMYALIKNIDTAIKWVRDFYDSLVINPEDNLFVKFLKNFAKGILDIVLGFLRHLKLIKSFFTGEKISQDIELVVNSDALKGIDLEDTTKNIKVASEKIDGTHKNGLANVPWDGYIAKLHKGERVLTASENNEYSEEKNYNSNFRVTNSTNRTKAEKHYHKHVTISPGAIVIQGSGLSKEDLKEATKEALNDLISISAVELGVDFDD